MSAIQVLGLGVGDRVKVRPIEEIRETLDQDGCLDALPFMPEMAQCCGREFTVLKRVDKINDLVDRSGLRRMSNAVILDGDRCDGAFHGGCQARCQSVWKEAWLTRLAAKKGQRIDRREDLGASPAARGDDREQVDVDPDLLCASRGSSGGGDQRFRCQQTEMKKASSYLAWWDPRQYWRDWWSGNATAGEMVRMFLFWLFTLWVKHIGGYRLLASAYDRLQRLRGGEPYPYRNGNLQETPTCKLDLQSGEWVQVKSHREILETLDTHNKNRGLWFDVEMAKYCGGVYRVLSRVDKIIDPKSGKMLKFASDCIILDGVTTRGEYHRFYPQNEYPFWREIWLRRSGHVTQGAARDPDVRRGGH
ncbi:MAG: hypothetical protein OEM98_02260 [Gammaproteobacteria bacterium]|nr:hypothetical protein [Gammaproteobacteria bacterium]